MYVRIGGVKFTDLRELQFEPETDVTGNTVPVNDLWVSVRTETIPPLGARIALYDDLDNLWCKYWVVYAAKDDTKYVRVHGESAISRLDAKDMPAKMYDGEYASEVIYDILHSKLGSEYELEDGLGHIEISGYAPKQTARVRLQWVCFVIGAYVSNYFSDKVVIRKVDDESTKVIPLSDTYWRPKVEYDDYVTSIKVTYYAYEDTVPTRTDTYVTIGDKSLGEVETYYVETPTTLTLANSSAPSGARSNVVEIDGITLLNQSNASEVSSFMAKYMFERTSLELECVNNGDYIPGERVYAFIDEDTMVEGYIQSCSFTFGTQAKSRIRMAPVEVRQSAMVVMQYVWNNKVVALREYRLPVGYGFNLPIDFVRATIGEHYYVFYPMFLSKTYSGVVRPDGNVLNVYCSKALDYHKGTLRVHRVDTSTLESDALTIA